MSSGRGIGGNRNQDLLSLSLALLFALLLSGTIHAQEPDLGEKNVFDNALPRLSHIAIGDLNGDGYLDLVATREGAQRHPVYLNDGAGRLILTSHFELDIVGVFWVELADLEGTGSLDLVATGWTPREIGDVRNPSETVVFFNDGSGTFPTSNTVFFEHVEPFLGDMDGDGDVDLISAGQIHINAGGGQFSTVEISESDSQAEQMTPLQLIDLQGNGRLDLIVQFESEIRILRNRGNDHFVMGSAFGPQIHEVVGATVADLNADGRQDIVLARWESASLVVLELCINRWPRHPNFSCQPIDLGDLRTGQIEVADVDANGWADILTSSGSRPNRIYFNQGLTVDDTSFPHFLPGEVFSTNAIQTIAADMDGNGALDLVMRSRDAGSIQFNDGGGVVSTLSEIGLFTHGDGLVSGDLDGDGLPDLVAGDMILLSSRPAAEVPQRLDLSLFSSKPALVDLDGRNGLDLVLVQPDGGNWVLFNDGNGRLGSERRQRLPGIDQGSISVALGDLDRDGHLDIVIGNEFAPNEIYFNDGSAAFTLEERVTFEEEWELDSPPVANGLALADIDGNGYLDIILGNGIGNRSQPNTIFYNDGSRVFDPVDGWEPFGSLRQLTRDLAVGDLNGDGRKDIVVANGVNRNGRSSRQSFIYLNRADGTLEEIPFGPADESTESVHLADMDGDGDLDILTGNADLTETAERGNRDSAGARIYLNRGDGHFEAVRQAGPTGTAPTFLTVYDRENDGSLEVSGLDLEGMALRINELDEHMAAADFDADGDLDRVIDNHVVLTDGASGPITRTLALNGQVISVAIADFDGENGPDLFFVLDSGQNELYLNNGSGEFQKRPDWLGSLRDFGQRAAVGDFDGDGRPDIVIGRFRDGDETNFEPSMLHLNRGSEQFISLETVPAQDNLSSVIATDLDGSGIPDLVRFNGALISFVLDPVRQGSNRLSQNRILDRIAKDEPAPICATLAHPTLCPGRSSRVDPLHPVGASEAEIPRIRIVGPTPLVTGGQTSRVLEETSIPVQFTLSTSQPTTAKYVRACFSMDGGESWRIAVPAGVADYDLSTRIDPPNGCPFAPGIALSGPLATGPEGVEHTFLWDTFRSGLFGQSDEVVLRLEAVPSPESGALANVQQIRRPYVAATSYPFRLRGTQVRVLNGAGEAAADAHVYRLPAGRNSGGEFLGRTDPDGYVEGRGAIELGDRLFAMQPVSGTDAYIHFHTSAAPVDSPLGLELTTVEEPGVQSLTVSADNPLILFDLDLSLEWDARADGSFLAELKEALLRASEVFYDVGNGQMALGRVRVFQNKENWLRADGVIYAGTGVRPRASMGGVVERPRGDVDRAGNPIPDAYLPGQIRMGPNWDPFGQSRAELSRDWWRALAHEFGHYYLYLPDNYLGYANDGAIIATDCQGSFMTSAYDAGYSEFLTAEQWSDKKRKCDSVLANRLSGRSDWETIRTFYPMLNVTTGLSGPGTLPFPLTDIRIYEPEADPPLPAVNYDLRDAVSSERSIVLQGQAYLFKTNGTDAREDDRLMVLGDTGKSDYIRVRGAHEGDELCVIDLTGEESLLGCRQINELENSLSMREVENWRPNLQIEPLFAPELALTLTVDAEGAPRIAYESFVDASPTISVTRAEGPGAGFQVKVDEPARTFTVTGGLTQPHHSVLVRPALAISVHLPVSISQPLYAQLLPADSGADPWIATRSPWAPMWPVGDAGRDFYLILALDYPIFAGAVRIWTEDERKTAVGEFYAPPVWKVDLRPGSGVDLRAGSGVDIRAGSGVDLRAGSGVDIRAGSGVDLRAGSGVDIRPGTGVDIRAGSGVDLRAGSGVDLRAGSGVDIRPGSGVDLRAGSGVDLRAGSGVDLRAGSGVDLRAGSGVDLRAGSGVDLRAGSGVDLRAGSGVDLRAGSGVDLRAGSGVDLRAGSGANLRGWGSNRRALGAPIGSADGFVTIYNRTDLFADTGTTSLEALPGAPRLPTWLRLVGQAYRFVGAGEIERTIAFNYLQQNVPSGYEHTLRIYFSEDEGEKWTRQYTQLDIESNLATAPASQSGLYALVATVEILLPNRGWNLFSYPIPRERLVKDALASIEGRYSTVAGFDRLDTQDPWKVFDPAAPEWVNDLQFLSFGNGYWIWVDEPTELLIAVAENTPETRYAFLPPRETTQPRSPPALYYGTIRPPAGGSFGPGNRLVARIGGAVCGETFLFRIAEDPGWGYRVDVAPAEAGGDEACGRPGARVEFLLDDSLVAERSWENRRPVRLDLQSE